MCRLSFFSNLHIFGNSSNILSGISNILGFPLCLLVHLMVSLRFLRLCSLFIILDLFPFLRSNDYYNSVSFVPSTRQRMIGGCVSAHLCYSSFSPTALLWLVAPGPAWPCHCFLSCRAAVRSWQRQGGLQCDSSFPTGRFRNEVTQTWETEQSGKRFLLSNRTALNMRGDPKRITLCVMGAQR